MYIVIILGKINYVIKHCPELNNKCVTYDNIYINQPGEVGCQICFRHRFNAMFTITSLWYYTWKQRDGKMIYGFIGVRWMEHTLLSYIIEYEKEDFFIMTCGYFGRALRMIISFITFAADNFNLAWSDFVLQNTRGKIVLANQKSGRTWFSNKTSLCAWDVLLTKYYHIHIHIWVGYFPSVFNSDWYIIKRCLS